MLYTECANPVEFGSLIIFFCMEKKISVNAETLIIVFLYVCQDFIWKLNTLIVSYFVA